MVTDLAQYLKQNEKEAAVDTSLNSFFNQSESFETLLAKSKPASSTEKEKEKETKHENSSTTNPTAEKRKGKKKTKKQAAKSAVEAANTTPNNTNIPSATVTPAAPEKEKKRKRRGPKTDSATQKPGQTQANPAAESDTEDTAEGVEISVDSEIIEGTENHDGSKTALKSPEEQKTERLAQKKAEADRTLFVGNVSIEILKKKNLQKEFIKLFKQHGKVVTVRFRSIAFSEPIPKRNAYALKKFHPEKDTCNAYVVMGTSEEATKALELNKSIFGEKHIRVDLTLPKSHDSSRSVFVGNMSFTEKEEALRSHFEVCGEIEYVRIVRDAKTGLGKGFGYVQFTDNSSIPLAIKLSGSKLNKRDLRVVKSNNKLSKKSKTGDTKGTLIAAKGKHQNRVGNDNKPQKVEGARSQNPNAVYMNDPKKKGAYARIQNKKPRQPKPESS